MARQSPLRERLARIEPTLLGYGAGDLAVPVVESFGELDFEYASLRRSAVLIDQPQRGTIEARGRDTLDFLNRMLTQKLAGASVGRSLDSFWLNRQGRIVADLRLLLLEGRVLMDVDVHVAASVVESLGSYLFSEDVELLDATERFHRIGLHGPDGPRLLEAAVGSVGGEPGVFGIENTCAVLAVAGHKVVVDRWDRAGEPGLELTVETGAADEVWATITAAAEQHNIRLRPAGWHAFNIARIETGTPLFMLDFGPDSLPAETTLVPSRISMNKGCYLGQEIVARMHNLGHPKQRLAAIRLDEPRKAEEFQPITGTEIVAFNEAADAERAVGAVTSSTVSPMLGGEVICFAMLKWSHASDGAKVAFHHAGGLLTGTVRERLRFWPRSEG
ncbi:MAG: hypothetical protein KJZ65_10320 [Phycisphaerales bacterium]|nr:hypothetical protein [Phycisphaerales bacterium]